MEKQFELAPILISVYDRDKHFENCIESLKRNRYSQKTHLFVAIDAPFKQEHVLNNKKVIDYAKKIEGFKKVTLIIRKKNYGEHENILQARQEILKQYDKMIFAEDDNIFSENFLSFMNKGLTIYEDREDIFSISGYKFPIKIPKSYQSDVYIWNGYTAWGVGIWKDKWDKVNWDISGVDKFLENEQEAKKICSSAEHVYAHLKTIQRTRKPTADTLISLHILKNKLYSIFPTISRVRNMGHDDSGEHGSKSGAKFFHNQEIYVGDKEAEFPIDIMPDPRIYKLMKNYSKQKLKTKLKIIAKSTLRTLKLYNK